MVEGVPCSACGQILLTVEFGDGIAYCLPCLGTSANYVLWRAWGWSNGCRQCRLS